MNLDETITPKLVDYNLKQYLHISLKKSHDFKVEFFNNILNISILLIFIIILISFLYFRYKGKLSQEEIYKKNNEKRVYVLSKLQQLNNIQNNEKNKLITNLPTFYY